MRIFLLIIYFLFSINLIGQTNVVLKNSVNLINFDSSFIVIKGNLTINNNSLIKNDGNISLTKDWFNNSGNSGIDTSKNGIFIFNGSTQYIAGYTPTIFNNIKLENDTKVALQDFYIEDSIHLLNTILETHDNLITLLNPNPDILTWHNSYISSQEIEGYFIRFTNTLSEYVFPVGNIGLENQMRVVELKPISTNLSSFGVGLSTTSPSDETGISAAGSIAPFPIENKAFDIRALNTTFYHRINQFSGTTKAKAKIYFQQSDDNNQITYRSVANWSSINNEWQNNDFIITNSDSIITNYNIPSSIAISENTLNNQDDIYTLSGINLVFPNSFTPNNDGYNDFFEIDYLIEEFPENEITIYNRWGETIFQSSPYLNDWDGTSTSKGLKLIGNHLPEDTYFYILKLDKNTPPIKKYIELIRD